MLLSSVPGGPGHWLSESKMSYMICGAGSVMKDSVAACSGTRIAWGIWALKAVICTMC